MTTDLALSVMPQIGDLDHQEQSTLNVLMRQMAAKWPRNELRARYHDGKNVLRSLGVAIPPEIAEKTETVVGWPEKAVEGLAHRIRHDGFVIPGESAEDMGINDMWSANRMDLEAPQAQISAFIHACAFLATTQGDVQSGEPDVLITARSALSGTGIWDPRRRRLSAALSIVAFDESFPADQRVTELVMYLPDKVVTVRRAAGRWWTERRAHSLGRVPVELLPYRPRLDRPFGQSRISRAVMSITDEAVRTVLRTEISAEFFAGPQRYILGAEPEAFEDATGRQRTGWESVIGRILAIGRDEDGELPTVGTFAQMSFQPHLEHMRSIAMRFAGATNLSVGTLGVVTDNPSSAEAIHANKEELLIEAENAASVFGHAYCNAIRTGVQIRQRLDKAPPELAKLRVKWRDPATPSRQAASDSVLKVVQAFPWMADSEVALEQLGWDETTIARAMADKRRAAGAGVLGKLTEAAAQRAEQAAPAAAPPAAADPAEEANALKAKFDALGVAIRAGVKPEDAARRLGLDGIEFTGATPASLRLPESQAADLEER
ncbi:phage portal protein [Nocardia sp. No.11]|uniref:phage portal protein n=1 Tax=Nocardia sp. No.11 TaxID=3128861 RepID=UPI00319E71CF